MMNPGNVERLSSGEVRVVLKQSHRRCSKVDDSIVQCHLIKEKISQLSKSDIFQ